MKEEVSNSSKKNNTNYNYNNTVSSVNNTNFNNFNSNNSNIDPDEQFVLDVIRTSKQESIESLVENLRLQESKSVMLIRILERYNLQLNNKELLK